LQIENPPLRVVDLPPFSQRGKESSPHPSPLPQGGEEFFEGGKDWIPASAGMTPSLEDMKN